MAYVRVVKTASGARAVQIVHANRKGARDIEHLGSAHSDAQVELLKAAARQRLAAGQGVLDLGVQVSPTAQGGLALPITSSRMGHLVDALTAAYEAVGFDRATQREAVFQDLVLARLIEPTSKLDAGRVLSEAGLPAPSYSTIKRRLAGYAQASWRQGLAGACAAHAKIGPASLVLFDVSTLLCRRRHNRFYADLLVMPMFGASVQVRPG